MPDDTNFPEDDRDLRLAREIGQASGVPEEDMPFVHALRSLKGSELPSVEASGRMWTAIDEAIAPARGADRRPVERRSGRRMRRWSPALAAALLVGAVVSVLILRQPGARLVASSGGERIEYVTDDGSVVTLRPHSALYRLENDAARYRLTGEAFFDVTPQAEGPFSVEAGDAIVEVLGTRFDLSTWSGTTVYLEEGSVRFAHGPSGEAVLLEPGQWSAVTATGSLLQPVSESADEYLDWMAGEIRFQQRPVGTVAAELGQHYGIDLGLPEAVRDETLTGVIVLEDVESSLDQLGRVMGGRFERSGPTTFRFEAE